MSEPDDDPYAELGENFSSRKRPAPDPDDGPEEGDALDRALAFQPLNDFGNGNRLFARHGEDLMHVKNIGWFCWNGSKWDLERGDAEAVKRGHRVAQAVTEEAKALKAKPGRGGPERVDRLFAWSVATGNMGRVRGMLDAAEPYLTQAVDALDADPFLAACANGTVTLSLNCRRRESVRTDRISRALAAPFDAEASCPRFETFMEEILPDPDMRSFVQRIFGYCLTGSIREQKFFLFWGSGRNGKSTLINVMRQVMGDYAMSSPVSTFLAKKEGNSGADASPDLARLPGARLVTAAEPPEGARLDESRIKEMTGGDPMTVRHLNKGFFEFRPCFKAIISTNHQPTIRGTDHGIWRRVLLVPFKVMIPVEDRDLEQKLAREAPGIMQWMLAGVEAWLERGLDPPETAIAATESYRADQDPVGEFLKAKCEVTGDYRDPASGERYEVGAKELRGAYKAWCEDEGLDALPAKTFGAKLAGHGIEKRKTRGLTVYVGLALQRVEFEGARRGE
ncbi:MAG TPA: phage/plasmid primase, P4 family [Rhizomicrobium sp.]|jgi:putative DNA primase/helicase|nr:phage/plasmid primase, P4 family [Rhizomicrobium sp.]